MQNRRIVEAPISAMVGVENLAVTLREGNLQATEPLMSGNRQCEIFLVVSVENVCRCEKATRQQGGFFSRENSSNGGKAIRTFLAS